MPKRVQTAATQPQAADTAQAAPDTVTLTEVLRADRVIVSNPSEAIGAFFDRLLVTVLDPDLWLGLVGLLLHILLIVALAFAAIRVVDRLTRRWTRRVDDLAPGHPRRRRTYTVTNLVSSSVRYLVWPIAAIMVLSEFGVNVGALVATAGIAGLAIGFGAQTLVKDVISGIFLLFDDSIHVGDLVKIGAEVGTVEEIGVRLIKVRKFDGELLMVPAGELRIFGNRSIDYVRVIVNVGLSYEQDIEAILPVMEDVAREWAEGKEEILKEEAPAVQAITDFGESSVTARIIVLVRPGEQFEAERALRRMLKEAFDQRGIEIPFPRRTVYMRHEDETPPRAAHAPAEDGHDAEGSD